MIYIYVYIQFGAKLYIFWLISYFKIHVSNSNVIPAYSLSVAWFSLGFPYFVLCIFHPRCTFKCITDILFKKIIQVLRLEIILNQFKKWDNCLLCCKLCEDWFISSLLPLYYRLLEVLTEGLRYLQRKTSLLWPSQMTLFFPSPVQ